MTPPVISAESLSKRYVLQHRGVGGYTSLREEITNGAAAFAKRLFGGGSATGSDSVEDFWALRDVSFEVREGERVGILGRNGAGKSTLLKILSRITEPTAGRAVLRGRIASLLEVGTGFHPELTGRENIFLNGAILGMTRAEIIRKFDEIVAFAEIEKFLDTPVKRYSSGMYVRLAFAVAAHLDPEILIVDEVLAVGDMAFQKKCIGRMEKVSGEGRTILFVSHNMEAVKRLCSRGIVLQKGSVALDGSADAAIRYYSEGGAGSQTEIQLPKPLPDAAAYATTLRIEDAEGRPTTVIPAGKPWQAVLRFRVLRPVDDFVVALGIRTPYQGALRTCWMPPRRIEPGWYQATFREETVHFCTGRYPLNVGLSSHLRSIYYTEEAGCLDIADYAEFASGFEPLKTDVGLVLNDMITKLEPISPPAGEARA